MGRMHRRSVRRRIAIGTIALLCLGSLATGAVFRVGGEPLAAGECGPDWTGRSNVVVIDASNPLAARSEATVREILAHAASGPRGTRVIVARVTGAAEYQPEILFDGCDPGRPDEGVDPTREGPGRRLEDRRTAFIEPLQKALGSLVSSTEDNGQSYLADTIMRIVADPAMHMTEGSTLLVASDLIENTDRSRPYSTGRIVLPDIREPFLAGIEVRIIELPAMPGATHLQTFELRDRWRSWLTQAGSTRVSMASPGLARSTPEMR